MFDDVPLMNKERDKAWEAFIKRKNVKKMFSEEGFGFPLNRGYYDLWCIAWAKAWDKGFHEGRELNEKTNTQVRNETLDEVARELERLTIAFGVDTVHSFMVLIKDMKE
jgi:hypothetical protein